MNATFYFTAARSRSSWSFYSSRSHRAFHKSSAACSSLRAVFFGSDSFSIENFLALHGSNVCQSGAVTLNVAVRSKKRVGRKSTDLREVPLAEVARENGVNVLQAETADDFKELSALNYDLAIAVSYGKLIPASFINSLSLGGINVHPSILPRHAGPAPIQWAILAKDDFTGVTVQTLHPHKFDKGRILRYSKLLPIASDETNLSLTSKLANVAGPLLVGTVEDIIRSRNLDSLTIPPDPRVVASHAPKIETPMRRINWDSQAASQIERTYRAFGGPLWTVAEVKLRKFPQVGMRRVLLDGIQQLKPGQVPDNERYEAPGKIILLQDGTLAVSTVQGHISFSSAKIEGSAGFKLASLAHPIFYSAFPP